MGSGRMTGAAILVWIAAMAGAAFAGDDVTVSDYAAAREDFGPGLLSEAGSAAVRTVPAR